MNLKATLPTHIETNKMRTQSKISPPTEKLDPQIGHNMHYSQSDTPTENAAAKEQRSLGYEHHKMVNQARQFIMNWTPRHMDAYSAIPEVAVEWIVEPG
jgi:hypothetical protein